ncbi:D-beta-hydroxybutyrate dehydrogenase, mitochondrial-like isoform X1 [Uloborus diversus]|uniref:D-beta-hydroxybutyrate dehydrogenase, mitochondrial-like isoform X1 n=1 Tax=Uloborus diversus TaxID=327109 RepID=UPI002409078E|nr:D-beta-hydroxybutyrate dehydrogenase, mitochondrial-like isoform X1 [Uloborus diversus]
MRTNFHSDFQIDFLVTWIALRVVLVTWMLWYLPQKDLMTSCFVLAALVFLELFGRYYVTGGRVSPTGKAVLITGCDTGFGFRLAHRLSIEGFQVFAGCLEIFRNDSTTGSRLKIDVTSQEDIQLAFDYVSAHLGENELWAVVNNAGISKGTSLGRTCIEDVEEVMNVNVLGAIRITKSFLPLLQKSRGRVVNVASASGLFPMPPFLPYCVSKHAMVAFTKTLRMELRRCGINVVSIQPWIYRTRLSKVRHDSNHVTSLQKKTGALFDWLVNDDVDEVIDAMVDALTRQHPPFSYTPGKWYLNCFLSVLRALPEPIADMILCFLFGC